MVVERKGIVVLGLMMVLACSRPTAPPAADRVSGPNPYYPLAPLPDSAQAMLHDDQRRLGQLLFFDPILSADSTISCASCHRPERAFTDGTAFSPGLRGQRTVRSTPTLFNVAWYHTGLFADGRATTLEAQALHPVADPRDMGASWPVLIQKLRRHPDYWPAFSRVYKLAQSRDLTPDEVGDALAYFQRSLVSNQSKYDRVQRGEDTFSEREQRGWTIFFDADPLLPQAECNHCHNDPLFTDQTYSNNGLDTAPTLTEFADMGRGGITGRRSDNGKFRVPSLRNIALTAPYMHDGRFGTLDAVLDHYTAGGHYADNVSPTVRPLALDARARQDLLAFLATLTDSSALYNPHWQAPTPAQRREWLQQLRSGQ